MDPWLKCLLCTHENLSSDPKHLQNRRWDSRFGKARFSERASLKNGTWKSSRKIPDVNLWPPNVPKRVSADTSSQQALSLSLRKLFDGFSCG